MDLALAILGGIALLLFLLHLKTRTRNPNVPGPPPLPILGNLLEMLPFIKQKRPGLMFLNAINKYGPVTRVTLPGSDFIFVSDPAVIKQVMRGDGGKIIKDKSFEHIMVDMAPKGLFALGDGPEWTMHRKKLQPAFGPLQLRNALDIVNRMSEKLYGIYDEKMAKGETAFDFYVGFTCALADVIGFLAFSYDLNNISAIRTKLANRETYHNLETMLAAMTKRLLSSNEILWSLMGVGRSDLKAPVAQVRGVVQQVIEAKQKSGTKKPEKEWDVLDRLMAESEDGERQFTVEEMQDEVLAFYMAGQDAMANALIWLLFALCNHPQHQDLIAEEVSRVVKDPNGRPTYEEATELKHLEACFKESLRYHTVLPGGSPRAVIAETEIGGYKIAPGTVVIASSQAMHMNQELWDGTADQYLPERWLKSKEKDKEESGFMPFSDGPHMCPGYRLAHLQFKAWIAPLMRSYRCSLVPGQDLEPEEAVSTGLRKGLKVKLERR